MNIFKKIKSRLSFSSLTPKVKDWKYFETFYFLPTVLTYSLNTYHYGEDFYYSRYFDFCFLWFIFGIEWKYGKIKENDI